MAETTTIVENEYLSSIGRQYNVPFSCVESGSDLSKQNFEDISWWKRLYSLRKLGISNIFNILPYVVINEIPENKSIISNNNMETILGNSENTKNYYAMFTATDKNIVFAVVTIAGDLYFVSEAVDLLRVNISGDIITECISKVYKYTDQMLKMSKRELNSSDMLKSDIMSYLLSDLCIKLGSGFNDFDHNIQRLSLIINDLMKSLFRDETSFPSEYSLLLNHNEMYRSIINKVMGNQDQIERKAMERGILIGSKFFTAFQRSGFIYDLDSGRWEKKIDMHPELCLWHNVLYRIPEKFADKFYVDTLMFDPSTLREESFIINATAKHPNVSNGGQVCIGSELCSEFKRLIRSKGLMTQEYVNFLLHIEDALRIINFDSAYYDFKKATGESPSSVLVRADIGNIPSTTNRGTLKRI